jgi:hypothetical protein
METRWPAWPGGMAGGSILNVGYGQQFMLDLK